MIDASIIAKLIMREENYVEATGEIEADETLSLAMLEVANVILKYHGGYPCKRRRRDLRG